MGLDSGQGLHFVVICCGGIYKESAGSKTLGHWRVTGPGAAYAGPILSWSVCVGQ